MRASLLLVAAALCAAPAGRAGTIRGTWGGRFAETAHELDVRIEDGVAHYRVRRTLRNLGHLTDGIDVELALPHGASATGLRMLAGGRWHDARLLDAADAQARYDALTDIDDDGSDGSDGEATRRAARFAPALLAHASPGHVTLRAFPIRGRGELAIEYTATGPVCYGDGRAFTAVPVGPGIAPTVRVLGAGGRAVQVHAPGLGAISDGACDGLADELDADDRIVIELAPPPIDAVAARYAAVPLADGRVAVRIELDAAPELRPAPRAPRVVFVLDGSYSTGDDGLEDQLRLVRAYLAHVPDAAVEIVIARRFAERAFDRFVPAAELDRALAELPPAALELGNGSALDEGVALASAVLGRAPSPNAGRIVAFTDARMRPAFAVDDAVDGAAWAIAGGHVLHVVVREPGYGTLGEHRDDDHELAAVALATGGVLLRVTGASDDAATAHAVVEGLVRPIRIDRPAADGDPEWAPSSLDEGDGYRHMAVVAGAAPSVTVSGWIWGRRWSRTVPRGAGFERALPAIVFGSSVAGELDADTARALAVPAGVVSPVTSLLAVDDGADVVVSEDELPMRELIGFGVTGGSSHCGIRCGGVMGGGRLSYLEIDRAAWLADRLRPAVARCAAGAPVVRIDTTRDEIVDVRVAFAPGAAADCVADAAWALRLPSGFDAERESFELTP